MQTNGIRKLAAPATGKEHSIEERAIVLFDGVCGLCNASVRFIIDRDPSRHFHFAPLQSAVGQDLLKQHGLPVGEPNSIVLIEGSRSFTRSSAVLRIARKLSWPWSMASVLGLAPRFLRDFTYDWIAARRYRWFGESEACQVPAPELRGRFLE